MRMIAAVPVLAALMALPGASCGEDCADVGCSSGINVDLKPVLKRYPDGVLADYFYEKDAPSHTPDWVKIAAVPRKNAKGEIHYIMINDVASLAWAANLASLEMHVLLARAPKAEELAILENQWKTHLARFGTDLDAAKRVIRVGESAPRPGLAEPELAAYTLVANTLLNLDETLTRN